MKDLREMDQASERKYLHVFHRSLDQIEHVFAHTETRVTPGSIYCEDQ